VHHLAGHDLLAETFRALVHKVRCRPQRPSSATAADRPP
jgi:hypothetical protein